MRRALVLSFAVAVACGSPRPIVAKHVEPAATASASASVSASTSAEPFDPHFREHAPPLGPEQPLVMPHVEETRLPNRARVLVAQTGGGMFAMRVVVEGFAAFPSERAAAMRVMTRSLWGGTPTRDAHELRRVLEKRFAEWGTYQTPDALYLEMRMPADDVRPCVDVMADVTEHPNFDQLTLGFELVQIVEQGQNAREKPAVVGLDALRRALYGDTHGYARSQFILEGTSTVDRIEVQRIYDETMDPAAATIVLAGTVERSVLEHVQRVFGAWRAKSHGAATPVAVALRSGPRLVVVDRPGSVQSEIVYGGLAPAMSSPDWYTMLMVHELLGAHGSSRLSRALVGRDAAAGAGETHLDARRSDGDFYWDSSVPLARTATVLAEIDRQLADLAKTPPAADELEAYKKAYVRHLPAALETAQATAEAVSAIPMYHLSNGALDALAPGVMAVTPDAVRKLAQDRLAPDRTRAVVVGDWSKLKTDLKALNWGPIEIRDTSGKVLRVEK